MSGGTFNYEQYKIGQIADQIEHVIIANSREPEEYGYVYNEQTICKFIEAVKILRIAEIYAQRVDWLLAGDDGEDTFMERLYSDLSKSGVVNPELLSGIL